MKIKGMDENMKCIGTSEEDYESIRQSKQMTIEEAMAIIYNDIIDATGEMGGLEPYETDEIYCLKRLIEAKEMSLEALKKQIPFKLVIDRKWSRCKCGRLTINYKYCPNCGQKLLRVGVKND